MRAGEFQRTGFSIDHNGSSLPICDGFVDYLAGVDPRLGWKSRGLTAHSKNEKAESLLCAQIEKAYEYIRSPGGQIKFRSFVGEVIQLYEALLRNDREQISNYSLGKVQLFVIGEVRTGGTYIFSELCRALNIDHEDLHSNIVHDSVPDYEPLFFFNENPQMREVALFELAQYLVWSRSTQSQAKAMVHKRIAYAHSLKMLDMVFGDLGLYLITVRHPMAVADSFRKLENRTMLWARRGVKPQLPALWIPGILKYFPFSSSELDRMNFWELSLYRWASYYMEVVKDAPYVGQIHPILFEEAQNFIEQFAGALEGLTSFEPKKFMVSSKEWLSDFPSEEKVREVMGIVAQAWQSKGLSFPIPGFF